MHVITVLGAVPRCSLVVFMKDIHCFAGTYSDRLSARIL